MKNLTAVFIFGLALNVYASDSSDDERPLDQIIHTSNCSPTEFEAAYDELYHRKPETILAHWNRPTEAYGELLSILKTYEQLIEKKYMLLMNDANDKNSKKRSKLQEDITTLQRKIDSCHVLLNFYEQD